MLLVCMEASRVYGGFSASQVYEALNASWVFMEAFNTVCSSLWQSIISAVLNASLIPSLFLDEVKMDICNMLKVSAELIICIVL